MAKDKEKNLHGRDAKRKGRTAKRRKPPKVRLDDFEGESGELTVIEGNKKGRKRRSLVKIIIRLAIVVVVVIGGIKIWQNWDSIAPDSFVIWFNEKMAGGQSGNGFPVALTGSSVISLESNRDGLVVLTDSAVVMYNHKGGEIFRRQHGYAKPLVKTAGKWILILENEGKRYRLETRGDTFVNAEVPTKILGGTVDAKGNFILVTESEKDYFCEVRLYNSKGELKYEWFSSKQIVSDVALSPDGKYFAASGFNAENGVLVSKILAFDLKSKDPIEVYNEGDSMIFAISFYDGGNIFALSDKAAVTVNISGTIKEEIAFNGQEVVGCNVGTNRAAVVLKDTTSANGGKVIGITETGDTAFSVDFNGEFRDVYCDADETLVLSSKQAFSYDSNGNARVTDIKADNRLICKFGTKIMVVGLNQLEEIKFK